MPRKVYIQNPGGDSVWNSVFAGREGFERIEEAAGCDLLVLTGGADINSELYGEATLEAHSWNHGAYYRDSLDVNAVIDAGDAFKLGICRGGQMLNVLSGGSLWQHCEGGHSGNHGMLDIETKRFITTSSIHHQQMRPGSDAVIVATCELTARKFGEHETWIAGRDPPTPDYEVVFYPSTRSLCIQGHPEYGPDQLTEYTHELIERYWNYGRG